MKAALFKELLKSVREAMAIERGLVQPSRKWRFRKKQNRRHRAG
jgi:hypothetical protein